MKSKISVEGKHKLTKKKVFKIEIIMGKVLCMLQEVFETYYNGCFLVDFFVFIY